MWSQDSEDADVAAAKEEDDRKEEVVEPERALMSKALLNPVVMSKIGPLLPPKDLLALRQTCCLWNSSFIPPLKRKHKPICVNTGLEHGNISSSLARFTELMQSSFDIPYSKYEIRSDGSGSGKTSREFKDFVSTCGKSLISISTRNIPGKEVATVEIWKLLFEEAPKLKELKLEPHEVRGEELVLPTPTKVIPNLQRFELISSNQAGPIVPCWGLVSNILHFAINLQHLSLNFSHNEANPLLLVQLLTRIRANGSLYPLDNLKSLQVDHVRAAELQILLEIAQSINRKNSFRSLCRLEAFSAVQICLNPGDNEEAAETARLLHALLTTLAPGLKKLRLGFERQLPNGNPTPVTFHIPAMSHLHSLQLMRSEDKWIHVNYNEDGLLGSNFLDLQRLSYVHEHFSRGSGSPMRNYNILHDMDQIFHPGVNELNLNIHAENLSVFGPPHLPGVKVATVIITGANKPAEISRLFSTFMWPTLTRLHLRLEFSQLTFPRFPDELRLDALLTGIPGHAIRAVKEELEHLHRQREPFTLELLRGLLAKYKTEPGLSDSEHLQEFVLEVKEGNQLELSDVGAYFAIFASLGRGRGPHLHLQLQQLIIRGVDKIRVSDQCRQFIKSVLAPYPYAVFNID